MADMRNQFLSISRQVTSESKTLMTTMPIIFWSNSHTFQKDMGQLFQNTNTDLWTCEELYTGRDVKVLRHTSQSNLAKTLSLALETIYVKIIKIQYRLAYISAWNLSGAPKRVSVHPSKGSTVPSFVPWITMWTSSRISNDHFISLFNICWEFPKWSQSTLAKVPFLAQAIELLCKGHQESRMINRYLYVTFAGSTQKGLGPPLQMLFGWLGFILKKQGKEYLEATWFMYSRPRIF